MHKLKTRLAGLFDVAADKIELSTIDTGLSHKSFHCRVDGESFYIKKYSNVKNISGLIRYQEKLTSYMRDRGVPASRLLKYSGEFDDIVVHEYVQGEIPVNDESQLTGIAELYSRLVLIGFDHTEDISASDYLLEINEISNRLKTDEKEGVIVDPLIHTEMNAVLEIVFESLKAAVFPENLLRLYIHDDFTEKNLIMQGAQVKLLCDWDSYRLRLCAEHIASTCARFCTERPLTGTLQKDKLMHFLRALHPELRRYISGFSGFENLFPYLATMNHFRSYRFRNSVVRDRPELKPSLLVWPTQHCRWLTDNHELVSDWVSTALRQD